MSNCIYFERRVASILGVVSCALAVTACKKEAAPAPVATAAAPQTAPTPTAERKSAPALHVLAKSPAGIYALSGTETALIAAGPVLYELTGGGLRQAPELHQGLHPMHYWDSIELLGSYPDAAYWFGVKRDPRQTAEADAPEPLRLMRRFKAAWGEADWLKGSDSDSLIGIVPWSDGHYLGVVRMPTAQDYRFALVGGKPKTEAQAPADDADAAAPAEPEAPSDPTLACPTIVQPEVAAGNSEGHLMVAGYRCSKPEELIVERFAPGKRKGMLETLPPGGPAGNNTASVRARSLLAAVAGEKLMFVAGVSSDYLVRFDGKDWNKETPDGKVVDLGTFQGSVWMTTSAGLFLYQEGKWNKQELGPDAAGVQVQAAFGLGNDLFAIGKDSEHTFTLLGFKASEKVVSLPPGYAPKTYREELIVGSSVCKDLFVVVKSDVKEKDNFDSMKAKLTGELGNLKLVVDNWKNGKLLGVVPTNFAQAEAITAAFSDSNPRIACHVPNVIRTVE